jgi:hypothetical protein
MVKIPDPKTNNPQTATNWTTIEKKILARNQKHFGQTSVTLLTSVDIHTLLSFGGTSSTADQPLFHNYDSSTITPNYYGQQLLAKFSTNTTDISPDITFDEMKQ